MLNSSAALGRDEVSDNSATTSRATRRRVGVLGREKPKDDMRMKGRGRWRRTKCEKYCCAGIERQRIGEICAALPDEIDVGDIGEVLWRQGITRDNLIDRLGGSP
jgi:hypothetical protein